jgi:hypothetical protein
LRFNAVDNDPIQLRVIVETCRQLLLRINHPETVAHLTALAETYERKLQQLRSRREGEPGPRREP